MIYLLACLLGVLACASPPTRTFTRMLTTLIHECGHALTVVALVPLGARLPTVRLERDTSGNTRASVPRLLFPFGIIVKIINLFAGYTAPVALGSTLLYLSVRPDISVFVPVSILFGIALSMTIFSRSRLSLLYSLFVLALVAFASIASFVFSIPQSITAMLVLFGSVLTVNGTGDIILITAWTAKRRIRSSDFDIAAAEMGLSPVFWLVLYWTVILAALTLLALPLFTNGSEGFFKVLETILEGRVP